MLYYYVYIMYGACIQMFALVNSTILQHVVDSLIMYFYYFYIILFKFNLITFIIKFHNKRLSNLMLINLKFNLQSYSFLRYLDMSSKLIIGIFVVVKKKMYKPSRNKKRKLYCRCFGHKMQILFCRGNVRLINEITKFCKVLTDCCNYTFDNNMFIYLLSFRYFKDILRNFHS